MRSAQCEIQRPRRERHRVTADIKVGDENSMLGVCLCGVIERAPNVDAVDLRLRIAAENAAVGEFVEKLHRPVDGLGHLLNEQK